MTVQLSPCPPEIMKKKKTPKPRDHNVVAMIGLARILKDKRTARKLDVVGRKEKHKSRTIS